MPGFGESCRSERYKKPGLVPGFFVSASEQLRLCGQNARQASEVHAWPSARYSHFCETIEAGQWIRSRDNVTLHGSCPRLFGWTGLEKVTGAVVF